MRVPIEKRMVVEMLGSVLMNFDVELFTNYVEMVNALHDMGSHFYPPNKLDLFHIRGAPHGHTGGSVLGDY